MTTLYRNVSIQRITAPALVGCSLEARVVYMHLLAGEHTCRVPGLVRAGIGALADETQLESAAVKAALGQLGQRGLVEVDEAARLIRCPGVLGDNDFAYNGKNAVVGLVKVLREMPDCPLRARHVAELRGLCAAEYRPLLDPLCPSPVTLPEVGTQGVPGPVADPSPTPSRTQEQEQEQEPVVVTAGARERAPGSWSTLGERLNITRRQLGMNERELARRTGLEVSAIRDFEADRSVPLRVELEVLARAFGDPSLLAVELPERDETVVEAVVRAEAEARGLLALAHALGRWPTDDEARGAEPKPVARTAAEAMRLTYAPGEGLQTLPNSLKCIARMLEECRRQFEQKGASSSAEYLRLEYFAKPQHRRRLLADTDLDERRDCTPPPSRGRGATPPRNPPVKPKVKYADTE